MDAVIAHHAHGIGRSPSLSWDTMPFLVDLLALEGVPRADAEACIYPYIEGKLRDLEDFHRIGPDMARLLGLPLAASTPRPTTTSPWGGGPRWRRPGRRRWGTWCGLCTRYRGRFFRPPGGGGDGTRAAPPGASCTSSAGLHPPSRGLPLARRGRGQHRAADRLRPPHARAAQEAGVSIVRIAHGACDNVGLNLLLDDVMREHGPFEVIACGAFERLSRLPHSPTESPTGAGGEDHPHREHPGQRPHRAQPRHQGGPGEPRFVALPAAAGAHGRGLSGLGEVSAPPAGAGKDQVTARTLSALRWSRPWGVTPGPSSACRPSSGASWPPTPSPRPGWRWPAGTSCKPPAALYRLSWGPGAEFVPTKYSVSGLEPPRRGRSPPGR